MFGKVTRFCVRVEVACGFCGKELLRRKKELSLKQNFYCSYKCSNGVIGRRDKFGDKNPFWFGGVSFLPYPPEFNAVLKKQIKERDGYNCVKCGKSEDKEREDYNKGLAIHHIDYVKTNCNLDNLTVLCLICNVKVNTNRDYWVGFFQKKLTATVA